MVAGVFLQGFVSVFQCGDESGVAYVIFVALKLYLISSPVCLFRVNVHRPCNGIPEVRTFFALLETRHGYMYGAGGL